VKPMLQQHTLFIRISETVRNSLARTRKLIFNYPRKSVSTSDGAKLPLPSAIDHRPYEHLEIGDLLHGGAPRQKCEIELSDRAPLSMGLVPGRMEVAGVRQLWTHAVNQALAQAGSPERVDHRSLAAQREEALQKGDHAKAAELDRAPQIKLGKARQMERRGENTDRGEQLRQVQAENVERKALVSEIAQLRQQMARHQSENTRAVPDR